MKAWESTNAVRLPEDAFQVAVYPVVAVKNIPPGRAPITFRFVLNALRRRVVRAVSLKTKGGLTALPEMPTMEIATKCRIVGYRVFVRDKPTKEEPKPRWEEVEEFTLTKYREAAEESLAVWNEEE